MCAAPSHLAFSLWYDHGAKEREKTSRVALGAFGGRLHPRWTKTLPFLVWFCLYEAGASVEVAPEEALRSGGWGEKKKTPKAQHARRVVQRSGAARCLIEAADVGRSA